MNKRKVSECSSDVNYVVIETTDKRGGVYVEFIPTLWLKNKTKVAARATADYFFPRRLPGQSIDQHQKFVKNAKFICMAPGKDDKWELLRCRILKINLGKKLP